MSDQNMILLIVLGYILVGNFVVSFLQSLFRGECQMREWVATVLVWPAVIVCLIGDWLGEQVRNWRSR